MLGINNLSEKVALLDRGEKWDSNPNPWVEISGWALGGLATMC